MVFFVNSRMNYYLIFLAFALLTAGGVLIYFGVTKDCKNETTPAKKDECNKSLDGSRLFMYIFAGLFIISGIFIAIAGFIGEKGTNVRPNNGYSASYSRGGHRKTRR